MPVETSAIYLLFIPVVIYLIIVGVASVVLMRALTEQRPVRWHLRGRWIVICGLGLAALASPGVYALVWLLSYALNPRTFGGGAGFGG